MRNVLTVLLESSRVLASLFHCCQGCALKYHPLYSMCSCSTSSAFFLALRKWDFIIEF